MRMWMMAVAAMVALGACAPAPSGPGLACTAPAPAGAVTTLRAARGAPVTDAVANFITAERAGQGTGLRTNTVTLDYLILSTGGQWGAFGSGFLAGWGENTTTPRPDFDIVTGASAGGLIAPFALAGAAFDDQLANNAGIGLEDVARQRGLIEALFSNSLLDNRKLEAELRTNVDQRLLDALKARAQENRSAFVGAVDLKTGDFRTYDLTALASQPNGEACIEEALLATSAIPGVFPPRQIDNGLLSDAGLREHVFVEDVRDAVGAANRAGVRVKLNAYVIVNGDLRLSDSGVENRLPSIAQRSIEIASDTGFRKSLLEVLRLDQDTQWDIFAITARDVDLTGCNQNALFDACITQRLFDAGRALGAQPRIPWLTAAELSAIARE